MDLAFKSRIVLVHIHVHFSAPLRNLLDLGLVWSREVRKGFGNTQRFGRTLGGKRFENLSFSTGFERDDLKVVKKWRCAGDHLQQKGGTVGGDGSVWGRKLGRVASLCGGGAGRRVQSQGFYLTPSQRAWLLV